MDLDVEEGPAGTFDLLLVLQEVVGAGVGHVGVGVGVGLQGDAVGDAGQQLVQAGTRRQTQVLQLPVLTAQLQEDPAAFNR